jgi:hypothetical protein
LRLVHLDRGYGPSGLLGVVLVVVLLFALLDRAPI